MTRTLLIGLLCVAAGAPAHAALKQFSNSDGYQGPFNNRVWSYNPLWTFEAGTLTGNQYVGQHGYGAGFASSEPFALVVRNNDGQAGNFTFNYQFESGDLGGNLPAALAGAQFSIYFDVCSAVGGSTGVDGDPMLTMAFGDTRANPLFTLGWSDGNHMLYTNGSGALQEFGTYTFNAGGWDRVQLAIDFVTQSYSLNVRPLTGNSQLSSHLLTPGAVTNIISNAAFTNAGTSMQRIYWEALSDPDTNRGFPKSFFDNFSNGEAPEPGTWAMVVAGLGVLALRKR